MRRSKKIRDRHQRRQAILEINAWLAAKGCIQLDPLNGIDNSLAVWMQARFRDGYQSRRGSLAIAAVKYEWPGSGQRVTLAPPVADQAPQGRRRRGPLTSRLPLPWEVVALIAVDLIEYGEPWMGYLTVLGFRGHNFWSITLHPIDYMTSSRSCARDETLVIDKEPLLAQLAPGLHWLRVMRGVVNKVVQLAQDQWNAAFQKVALHVGGADPRPDLFGLRHGGARFGQTTRARPDLEVMLRGRWATDACVQRYEKHGRVAERLHRLGATVMAEAVSAPAQLGRLLAKP